MIQASSYPDSYYAASTASQRQAVPLQNTPTSADVCVIGGGFTGLSTAIHLLERGYSVVLLEANRIGFGASGRNGGQIVNSYSRDLDFILRHYGPSVASTLGTMAFEGGRIIRRLVSHYHIDCHLTDGGIFAACNHKQFKELIAKKQLWESHQHTQLELIDAADISTYIGSARYKGALLDHSGGHMHPLNLALGEAAAIESLGGKIYEQSPVTDIKKGERLTIVTEKGSITADYAVVAGNAYLSGVLPELQHKAIPCGSQVIATEPLSPNLQQQLLPQNHCVEDCNYLLDYYRLSGDGRLIYGGGVTYGAREPDKIEALIRPKMLQTFPQLDRVAIDYTWTGNFLLTLMRLPQFGRLDTNIFYAQGYSGHGVTSTHLAGELLASAIQGQAERFDVMAGLPQYPFPGGQLFRIPLTAMGAFYYQLRDKLGI